VVHTPEEDVAFYSTVVFPRAEVWLCERVDIAAGFIAFRPGWVDHLYIHPDHQGLGLGRTLLKVAQESESEIRLWTFQGNARARRFYERNGFTSELETDGASNEERQPDVLYYWKKAGANPEPFLPKGQSRERSDL
jgi:GNAT superfamily N-acetyltransferase